MSATSVALTSYLTLLRKNRFLIAVSIIVGMAAALLALTAHPKAYTARTGVLLPSDVLSEPELLAQAEPSRRPPSLDTEAELVRSTEVLARFITTAALELSVSTVVGSVEVSAAPNTNVLIIGYRAERPATAQRGAQNLALTYLRVRAQLAELKRASEVSRLTARLASLQRTAAVIRGQEPAEAPINTPSVIALRNSYRTRLNKITNAISGTIRVRGEVVGASLTPGEIVQPAALPRSPSDPDRKVYLTSGALLGLLVGVGLSRLLDGRNRHITSRREVEDLAGSYLVAGIRLERGRIPANWKHYSRLGRQVATGIPKHREARIVLVASPDGGRAVSLVAAGLAATTAQSGISTALAVCAEQQGAIERLLGLRLGESLVDAHRRGASLDDIIVRSKLLPRVAILRLTDSISDDSDTQRPSTHHVDGLPATAIRAVQAIFDRVIVVGPDLLQPAGAVLLSRVDAVVPVITVGQTRANGVAHSLELARGAKISVPGLVAASEPRWWRTPKKAV
jgi:polysaccharide biosynthesis transport protein